MAIAPSGPAESDLVNQQIANFNKLYPNIKVTREDIAQDYDTKIKTEVAANSAPDIYYRDSLAVPDDIADGVLEPLDSYTTKMNVDTKDFYPALLKAFTGPDGKLYGLPKDHNTLVMFYNKDMFTKAGITTPPTTWDELRAAATKLKAVVGADGTPIAAEPDLARLLAYVYQANGSMLSPDLKSSTVSQPGFKDALNFYYNLRKDGLSKKSSELGAEWPGDAIGKGKAAIAFEGGWAIPFLDKSPLKGGYGVANMIKGASQGTMDFTVAWVMSKQSKNKDAAFALLNYLTGPEGQSIITNSGLALPSRQSLTPAFEKTYPNYKPILDGVQFSHPWQFGVGFGGFADKVNPVLQGVFSGSTNVDDAVKKIDDLVKTTLKTQ